MKTYVALWWDLFALSWTRERRLTVTSLALIGASVVAVATSTLSLRVAVDATSRGQVTTAVVAAIAAAAAFALTVVIQNAIQSMLNVTLDRVARLNLHSQIHRLIATLEGIEHLERTDYLDRLTVLRRAPGKIMAWAWYSILAFAGVVQIAVMLVLLGTVSPWLLLMLLFAALPIWSNHRGQRAVTAAEVDTAEAFRLQQQLFDLTVQATSAKEIKIGNVGVDIARRQAEAWDWAQRLRFRAQLIAAYWKFAGWALFVAFFVASIALVAYRTMNGQGTLGDLVLVVIATANLRQILHNAVASALRTAGARRYLDPYLWLRSYVAEQRSADGSRQPAPPKLRDGIRLEGLSFGYPGTDTPALAGVDAALPAGSVVAVVGEYGSGKTTLVKMLLKLYRPDGGRILVDGTDLRDLETAQWRERTSAAFQDFARFHTVLSETVGLGDPPAVNDLDRVRAALREADAEDLVAGLPEGMRTQLGRELGGVELSEGQWQRTALARASMRTDPLLFVLDEPTASLDALSEQAVFQRYMSRARALAAATGAVTVVVSHRFSTVAEADLILVLDRGRVVESGTHQELMRYGGQYAELYRIQLDAYSAA